MADCSIQPLPAYVCTEAVPYCIGKLSLGLQSLVQNDSMYTAYAFETADVDHEWIPARYKISGGEITECETGDCPGSLNPASGGVIYTTWYAPAITAADGRDNWVEPLTCGTTISAVGIGTPAVSPTVFTATAVAGSAYSSTASNGDTKPCTGGVLVKNTSGSTYPAGSVLNVYGTYTSSPASCVLAATNSDYSETNIVGIIEDDLPSDGIGCLITEGIVRICLATAVPTTSNMLHVGSTAGVLVDNGNKPSRFRIIKRADACYLIEVKQLTIQDLCPGGTTGLYSGTGTIPKGSAVETSARSLTGYTLVSEITAYRQIATTAYAKVYGICVTDMASGGVPGCIAIPGQTAVTSRVVGGTGPYLVPITTGENQGAFRRVVYKTMFYAPDSYTSDGTSYYTVSIGAFPDLYAGYFTLIDMGDGTVAVATGNAFNFDSPTAGSTMPARIGGSTIYVSPVVLTPSTGSTGVYLKWSAATPSVITVDTTGGTDSADASYYLLGTITKDSSGITNILQVHNTGVPQLWQYACPVSS